MQCPSVGSWSGGVFPGTFTLTCDEEQPNLDPGQSEVNFVPGSHRNSVDCTFGLAGMIQVEIKLTRGSNNLAHSLRRQGMRTMRGHAV